MSDTQMMSRASVATKAIYTLIDQLLEYVLSDTDYFESLIAYRRYINEDKSRTPFSYRIGMVVRTPDAPGEGYFTVVGQFDLDDEDLVQFDKQLTGHKAIETVPFAQIDAIELADLCVFPMEFGRTLDTLDPEGIDLHQWRFPSGMFSRGEEVS